MAPPDDEDDDPAVYRSGRSKTNGKRSPKRSPRSSPPNGKQNGTNGHSEPPTDEDAEVGDVEDEDDDDSTLLTVHPGYNRLLLVLRDERVMRFVKYVSAAAESSRWDVCGEYEVGMMTERGSSDDGDDEEEI